MDLILPSVVFCDLSEDPTMQGQAPQSPLCQYWKPPAGFDAATADLVAAFAALVAAAPPVFDPRHAVIVVLTGPAVPDPAVPRFCQQLREIVAPTGPLPGGGALIIDDLGDPGGRQPSAWIRSADWLLVKP